MFDNLKIPFFEDALLLLLLLLPKNYKVVFVRLDKGYFGEDTFEYLEEKGIRYVAASKNTHPLRKIASSLP
ncbi:transposase [Candidatus Aerophobetes bacterium]|nr:transposase [Candidatus Aerophobetes bacterium]